MGECGDLVLETREQLSLKVEMISNNPVVNGLLQVTGGLLAVLDDRRRILTVNDALLHWLGLGTAQQALGMRPGEALQCIHCRDVPGGCGEGPFCENCGAAIAMALSVTRDAPAERTCAMSCRSNGGERDLYLRVHSCPLRIDGQRILLLFLQDITAEQQAGAVQRIFFHDVANTVSALCAFSELLSRRSEGDEAAVAGRIMGLARRLDTEIRLQRALAAPEQAAVRESTERVSLPQLIADMAAIMEVHASARGKRLVRPTPVPETDMRTDAAVLMRVLTNMLVNAFEATDAGGEVRLWVETGDDKVSICVWNRAFIDEKTARRIFQRNFSTKAALGRGLGTYSMKLFTERFLHGQVSFATSPTDGTTFRVTIPKGV